MTGLYFPSFPINTRLRRCARTHPTPSRLTGEQVWGRGTGLSQRRALAVIYVKPIL